VSTYCYCCNQWDQNFS